MFVLTLNSIPLDELHKGICGIATCGCFYLDFLILSLVSGTKYTFGSEYKSVSLSAKWQVGCKNYKKKEERNGYS